MRKAQTRADTFGKQMLRVLSDSLPIQNLIPFRSPMSRGFASLAGTSPGGTASWAFDIAS